MRTLNRLENYGRGIKAFKFFVGCGLSMPIPARANRCRRFRGVRIAPSGPSLDLGLLSDAAGKKPAASG